MQIQILGFLVGLAVAGTACVQPSTASEITPIEEAPSFLPDYFAPALALHADDLHLAEHKEQDKSSRYVYVSRDQVVSLAVEILHCDNASCPIVFDNARKYFNQIATQNDGQFKFATATEFRVDWQSGLADNAAFVFQLPQSVLFWSYGTRLARPLGLDARFDSLRSVINRNRYESAKLLDNVEFGRWSSQFRELAEHLLEEKRPNDAVDILKAIVAANPADYVAQTEFAVTTHDSTASRNSARAVFENAEDPALINRVSKILDMEEPRFDALPTLRKGETGLQLVVIPLPPCDIRLLGEAAAQFEQAFHIPVQIARLPDAWVWDMPDRVASQRAIQQAIIQQAGPMTDFAGWTSNRYGAALLDTVKGKDAWSKYSMQVFLDKLKDRSGQYRVDPYLERLLNILNSYQSADSATMYVGVTGANIYSGDSNYIFSLYTEKDHRGASILSYAMMTAKELGTPYESRKRLVERIVKEMVPAAFKALRIARPVDPTDPYSYANGVERLDQKTLILSQPTRDALDRFR